MSEGPPTDYDKPPGCILMIGIVLSIFGALASVIGVILRVFWGGFAPAHGIFEGAVSFFDGVTFWGSLTLIVGIVLLVVARRKS